MVQVRAQIKQTLRLGVNKLVPVRIRVRIRVRPKTKRSRLKLNQTT